MEENKIIEFANAEFGTVRTTTVNDEVMFVGKDVADILGYQNGSRDINRHVDEEDRHKVMLFDGNQDKETIIINESGLYSLILSSKMPNAKKFKRWVTSEVLPSIRANGGYIAGQETLSEEDLMAKALVVAQRVIERKNEVIEQQRFKIEQDKPKTIFADAVATSRNSILVGELAKLICQNGVEIGQRRLFAWMRDNGYLIKRKGSDYNLPTQRSMEMGLYEIKESTHLDGNGCNVTNRTAKVTGKGQIYFINKFLKGQTV